MNVVFNDFSKTLNSLIIFSLNKRDEICTTNAEIVHVNKWIIQAQDAIYDGSLLLVLAAIADFTKTKIFNHL